MNIEQFEVAAAVHNSGGIVIAQVDRVVKQGSIPAKEVLIHGFMVDYLVEGRPEYSMQSFETDAFRPEIAGLASIPAVGFDPLPMGPRKISCRRAAMELRPNSLINLGIGMPGGIGSVAEEEGLTDLFTLSLECGPLGGIPLGGIDFGATINPEAMYRMADILRALRWRRTGYGSAGLCRGGPLGECQCPQLQQPYGGSGGLYRHHAERQKALLHWNLYCGEANCENEGGWPLHSHPGPPEKVLAPGGGHYLLRTGGCAQGAGSSPYITEQAVFRLEQEGLTLVEIAHGVDLQRDILDQMEFKPVIPEYVRYMDPRLFREGPMGLTPEQMEMLDPEYEFWRDLRPGGEGGESRG